MKVWLQDLYVYRLVFKFLIEDMRIRYDVDRETPYVMLIHNRVIGDFSVQEFIDTEHNDKRNRVAKRI